VERILSIIKEKGEKPVELAGLASPSGLALIEQKQLFILVYFLAAKHVTMSVQCGLLAIKKLLIYWPGTMDGWCSNSGYEPI
jgi:hypothetical protein